jgi:hypothetical protein
MRAAAALQDRTRVGVGRLFATWLMLLAFALQSYVTQTHFHPPASVSDAAAAVSSAPHASARAAPPGGDEALACPLCQAVAAAGAFLTPRAVVAAPLVALTLLVSRAPAETGRTAGPSGFAWRSRAPPQS